MTDDRLAHLKEKRSSARKDSDKLLWENIESLPCWGVGIEYNDLTIDQKKILFQHDHSHPALVQFNLAFAGTITQIEPGAVQDILQFGAARRANSIRRAVNRFCEIAPPQRKDAMSLDEAGELSDAICLIYVHMLGILDAFAIAICRIKGGVKGGDEKSERIADLLKPEFHKKFQLGDLEILLEAHEPWLKRIREELRHRFVHRVPPYIPTSMLTPDEIISQNRLHEEQWQALFEGKLDVAAEIEKRILEMGQFCPWIVFSDNGSRMNLHPTVLDDVMRFNCLSLDILSYLVPLLSFRQHQP